MRRMNVSILSRGITYREGRLKSREVKKSKSQKVEELKRKI